ncbi:MAG: 6-pyruvoyl tetrahydrobiopterin synthase [Candidatus Fischerbacteria bacterium RBG_13_37_8]|uniref:6-carboxy-5,6,7,8-tetrahydropterin synthase n=1 Tax=Candidatus Fischerbacteria bacterium RBG_13_37_8 TaxID=1817863 RepID=A0A1F5V5W5_9BACT|nr:MAG: 6-pyruvoyl tetrahydrobiopterin synthase [Candidatus Fischerbacteria bacterium RBG_13_37_8]
MKVYLTTTAHFCAGHRLYDPLLSNEKNAEIFGKCSNPSGHGHNYKLFVTVCGLPDPATGMIIDLTELKNTIEEKLIKLVDHKNLNTDVSFLKGINPTAENLVVKFWEILHEALPEILYELTLYETDKQWVSFKGMKRL